MRTAIAVLLIALIGLASYQVVMSQVGSQAKSVNLVGNKLVLKGFSNPTVRISGCGEEIVVKGSTVEIPVNCNVSVEVYSEGRLVFTGSFSLNP